MYVIGECGRQRPDVVRELCRSDYTRGGRRKGEAEIIRKPVGSVFCTIVKGGGDDQQGPFRKDNCQSLLEVLRLKFEDR